MSPKKKKTKFKAMTCGFEYNPKKRKWKWFETKKDTQILGSIIIGTAGEPVFKC